MARPVRHDADYFPFYAKDGRTLFILENKYGCKGTGFFTNVMRLLTLTPDHHICIKDEADQLYFYSRCKCDEVSGAEMLLMMVKTGKLDRELFEKAGVIMSQDLLDSLGDAYRKRSNKIITINQVKARYGLLPDETPVTGAETPDNSGDNPQRKGKERKGKESIAAPVITPEETEEKEGPFELPSKEDIVESSPSWIRDKIDEVCKRLVRENIYPEAVNYVLAKRNMRVSERALLHALCRVHISKPKHPKAFMDKIIAIENGNYNEYEHCQSS